MAYLQRRSQRPWRSEPRERTRARRAHARNWKRPQSEPQVSALRLSRARARTHTQAGAMSLIQGLISVLLLAIRY